MEFGSNCDDKSAGTVALLLCAKATETRNRLTHVRRIMLKGV